MDLNVSGVEMSELKILIVEDESLVAMEFASTIQRHGYSVVGHVNTPKKVLEIFRDKQNSINLIIMDINLNDMIDGIDLYKSLESESMVIYLTAYKDEQTISKAIPTDPLGYLVKPLNESELVALLELAKFKLNRKKDANLIELSNGYRFDMEGEILYHEGAFVKLGPKKLQLLKLLANAKGGYVTFKAIEEELWKEKAPSESTVRTLIYRLRSVLGDNMIESESNYGIRLV